MAYPLTWDLTTLYAIPGSSQFETDFKGFIDSLKALIERSSSLPAISTDSSTITEWIAFIEEYGKQVATGNELQSLIGCYAAGDAGNRLYQDLEAQLAAVEPLRNAVATNVELAIGAVDANTLRQFLASNPSLGAVAFFFKDARERARMRLSRDAEQLVSELAVDGFSAWSRLYDRLSGSLRVSVMERGEIVEKSPGQVPCDSPERSVRQNNFYAACKAWDQIADTCADCLNHIAGYRLTKYSRLGLSDHLEAPLIWNRMQRETLEQMWSVVSERRPKLREYLSGKAKLLGLDQLAWYDLMAPLPTDTGAAKTLAYDDACRTTIESLGKFSPEFGEFAECAISNRWVETENRPGKRQGGFCTDFPIAGQSRIFMTYTNSPDSMSTLAHELGHAYHSHVLRSEPTLVRDYPMNLAETASTFAEQILGQVRLKNAANDAERRSILDGMLGDAVAFCMNIHTRFVFEDAFHRKRTAGELSANELDDLMRAAQHECYCGALAEDGYYPRFWASKLHFYITEIPFYNFPYTFGYLLSVGLYVLAQKEPATFPERFKQFLIETGRQTAEDAVKSSFGIDLTQREFWNTAMEEIDRRIDQFTSLVD